MTISPMTQLLTLTGLTLDAVAFWSFAFVAGLTALMTCVLFYHWVRYNPGLVSTVLVMTVYSTGALALLLSLFGVVAQL